MGCQNLLMKDYQKQSLRLLFSLVLLQNLVLLLGSSAGKLEVRVDYEPAK